MKKWQQILCSYLLFISSIIIIFGIGYGIFVDVNYFFYSKKTTADIIDNYKGNYNEPYMKLKYFDEFKDEEVLSNIKIKNYHIEDYQIGERVEVVYTVLEDWIYVKGQKHPKVLSLVFKILLLIAVIFVFINMLKKSKWRILNMSIV